MGIRKSRQTERLGVGDGEPFGHAITIRPARLLLGRLSHSQLAVRSETKRGSASER